MRYLLAIAASLLLSSVAHAQAGEVFALEGRSTGTYFSQVYQQRLPGLYIETEKTDGGAGVCTVTLQGQAVGGFWFDVATGTTGDQAFYPKAAADLPGAWSSATVSTFLPSSWRQKLVVTVAAATCRTWYNQLP